MRCSWFQHLPRRHNAAQLVVALSGRRTAVLRRTPSGRHHPQQPQPQQQLSSGKFFIVAASTTTPAAAVATTGTISTTLTPTPTSTSTGIRTSQLYRNYNPVIMRYVRNGLWRFMVMGPPSLFWSIMIPLLPPTSMGVTIRTRGGHITEREDDDLPLGTVPDTAFTVAIKGNALKKAKATEATAATATAAAAGAEKKMSKQEEEKQDASTTTNSWDKVEVDSSGEEVDTAEPKVIIILPSTSKAGPPTTTTTTSSSSSSSPASPKQQGIPTPNRPKRPTTTRTTTEEGKPTIPAPPSMSGNSENNNNNSSIVEEFMVRGDADSSKRLTEEVRRQADKLSDFLVLTRRALHKRPELMYNEQETSAHVQQVLRDWNVSYTTGWAINTYPNVFPGPGGFGIVADIGTGQDPCVLLRADMDALPIHELTAVDFKSQYDNKMHACGHDAHTTMLLGAVSILKSMEHSLKGTVRVIFQPAEEGGAGGKRMREEGVLDKAPKPKHAFGMHVWPTLPTGTVAARPGALMAACERFEIMLEGVGGHAAMPHLTVDPIVTASSIIMNLQTVVSRTLNPLEAGVCSITKIEAGEAFNIIPQSALLRGTIRALTTDTLLMLRNRVQHIVETTALVYGCNATITYSPDFYPPTINDPELYETFAKDVGALVSEEGYVREIEPTMGAEDFSFLAESIPSTFFFLGQGSGNDPPTSYGLHHPKFSIDESVMPRGVELHVNLAVRALRKLQKGDDGRGPGGLTSG